MVRRFEATPVDVFCERDRRLESCALHWGVRLFTKLKGCGRAPRAFAAFFERTVAGQIKKQEPSRIPAPDLDRARGRPKRDRFGPPGTRPGVRLTGLRNGLATRMGCLLAQPIIPVMIAKMKPIAPSQSKSPVSVPRPAEMSGSILLYMIGLSVNVGQS